MADDRRLTTDRFYGGTSRRLQLLQRFLSYVEMESTSRSEAKDWILENTNATSRDAIDHHLGFLEAIELIEQNEDAVIIGWRGQQYIESTDPNVLYRALRSNVKGFDTILEQLLQTPLTDKEIRDVLVSEFEDINMESVGVATRHREWLQVLGYIERSGNVNQLTQEGHDLATRAAIEDEKNETTENTNIELSEGTSVTERREAHREEAIRDNVLVRELKRLYDDRCQICGERRQSSPESGYSEVHHLMPLGEDGPDKPENMVVVCPNHHVDFENRMLTVDPQTLEITHQYESEIDGRRLLVRDEHDIEPQYLAYHNQIADHSVDFD